MASDASHNRVWLVAVPSPRVQRASGSAASRWRPSVKTADAGAFFAAFWFELS